MHSEKPEDIFSCLLFKFFGDWLPNSSNNTADSNNSCCLILQTRKQKFSRNISGNAIKSIKNS